MGTHVEGEGLTRRSLLKGMLGTTVVLSVSRPGRASAARPVINLNWQYGELSLHTTLLGFQKLGLTDKYGLRFNIIGPMLYGAETVQNYVAGRGDIVSSGDFPSLTNVLRVPETTYIGMSAVGQQHTLLVSRPEIKSLNELRGKRVAIAFGSTTEWAVRQVLADLAGMDADRDVKLVHAMPAAAMTMMARGELEAAAMWVPYPEIAVLQHGFKILEWGFGSKYTLLSPVYIRDRFLAANQELVQDFCRALVENLKYIYEHVEEAALWVAQSPYLAQDFETIKVALRVLAGLPDPRISLPKGAENNLVPWRRDVPDILERANAFMKAHPPKGTTWEGVPNVRARVNSTFIVKAIREIAPDLYGKLV